MPHLSRLSAAARTDATFDALHREMTGLGFELVNVSPPLTAPDGTAVFIDGCYAKRA